MSTKEFTEFVDYCLRFHGLGGVSAPENAPFTRKETYAAARLWQAQVSELSGDTFDREAVARIVYFARELEANTLYQLGE